MTFKYNNVYINDYVTVTGPYEKKGPLSKYFNYSYDDLYCNSKTFEQAEISLIKKAFQILNRNSDLFISGDLSNQLVSSSYAAKFFNIPYIGVYTACSTSTLSIILASCLIDKNYIKDCIVSSSSHNCNAEKQFRYPVEYGAPKKKTNTFTTTGCAMAYLSNNISNIKVESSTIGNIIDMNIKDVNNMGAVMASSAAFVIDKHLKDMNRSIDYYDLVLTGDLGKYGKEILKEYLEKNYNINLCKYNDCGVMLYDNNKDVNAGASGVACLPLVSYSYIFKLMKEKKLKKVLLVATGSLHSKVMVDQKLSIPSISHAVSLEAIW